MTSNYNKQIIISVIAIVIALLVLPKIPLPFREFVPAYIDISNEYDCKSSATGTRCVLNK